MMTLLTVREKADKFLVDLFREHPGGIYRDDAVRLAEEQGISERTLMRAVRRSSIVRIRQGRHRSIWRPPVEEGA